MKRHFAERAVKYIYTVLYGLTTLALQLSALLETRAVAAKILIIHCYVNEKLWLAKINV